MILSLLFVAFEGASSLLLLRIKVLFKKVLRFQSGLINAWFSYLFRRQWISRGCWHVK